MLTHIIHIITTIMMILITLILTFKGNSGSGQFLQVSGLKIIFDVRRPPGDRLLQVSDTDKMIILMLFGDRLEIGSFRYQ